MQKIKQFIAILMVLILAVGIVMPVAASDIGFTVTPVIPQNQIGNAKGYFDLKMQPGQKQDLTIVVANSTSQDILVKVEAITASTNQSGIINYTTPGPMDDSLQVSFADIATTPEGNITIRPGSTENVVIALEMPEEVYEGYLLGGIQVEKQLTEEELRSGESIVNQYSYVIGVKLTEDETPVSVDFTLGDIQAELINGKANIVANIHNIRPIMAKGMEVTVGVYTRNNEQPVMERVQQNKEMAPNSIFGFKLVDDAGYGIKAGNYICKVNIEYNDQTWELEKEFEIKAEEAAYINENAGNQGTNQTAMNAGGLPTWAIIAIVGGVILLIVMIILLVSVMKRMKHMNNTKND